MKATNMIVHSPNVGNSKEDKNTLRFYLHVYWLILSQDIKSKMSYREDFIISTIGMLFTDVSGFIAFYILFQNFPSILGWSYYEMLFLYGFSLVALTPVQCLFDNNWNLRSKLYTGEFIKYYFRPINLFFYFISEVFDLKGIGQFVFGVITVVYTWKKLAIPCNVWMILIFILGVLTASLFMVALMNFAAGTSFWLMGSSMIMILMFKFKDYARYPVTIFNYVFRFIFTFIIPIAFMAYYPSLLILRPGEVPVLTYLSPVIGGIFVYLSYRFWMFGANNYAGTGS